MGRRRLFIALWPPADVIEQLGALERPGRKGLRWTTADQWHVTLRFLGSVEEQAERALRYALARVEWDGFGATGLRAGPGPTILGRTIWALPIEGAAPLADISARTANAALLDAPPGHDRPFRGHITLARAKTPAALRDLPAEPFQAEWDATEVTLVSSTLAPTGARYEIVDKWSLTRPGG